jgi:hypothetical protein
MRHSRASAPTGNRCSHIYPGYLLPWTGRNKNADSPAIPAPAKLGRVDGLPAADSENVHPGTRWF